MYVVFFGACGVNVFCVMCSVFVFSCIGVFAFVCVLQSLCVRISLLGCQV